MNQSTISRLLAALFLAASASALAAESWVEESNAHSDFVMRAQAQFQPEAFSGLGIESADAQIIDLREDVYERSQQDLERLIAEIDARKRTTEDPRVLQDLDILKKSLQDQHRTAELNRKYLLPYFNLSQSLFFGFRSLLDPRNDPARYPAALERLRQYTGQVEGTEPITRLAIARSSERFDVPGLLGPYIGQLEEDLGNVPRFLAGMQQAFTESGLEGWQGDLELLGKQLDDYAAWLRQEIQPRAAADHRLPEELYADNLKNFGVDADPLQLIRAAQLEFADLQFQMQAIAHDLAAQKGWASTDYRDALRQLGAEQMPEGELIAYYRDILRQIEDIIREQDIISLPEREAAIRMATEAESAAAPAPFLSPPQLIGNTGQPAEFVLVTRDASAGEDGQMTDFGSPASTWALTAHEARPGHEMQFASMLEAGVSTARAIYAFNSANVEGWGLYAEAIMLEHFTPEARLFGLRARLMRAARAFLDPMLNLGQIEREQALAVLVEDVGLSPALAQQEVDRYTFLAPGQATAYYFGYMNLMALRTEVELRLRDRFQQREYHDFLLDQGLLPPEVLRQAVLDNFVAPQFVQ